MIFPLHARLVMALVGPLTQLVVQLVLACGSTLDFNRQVYSWRSLQPEAEGDFGQVDLVYIKDVPLAV